MRRFLLTILTILTITAPAIAQTDFNGLMEAARKQRDAWNEPLAVMKFGEALKLKPDDYEALWNASLLSSRIGNRIKDDEGAQRTWFEQADELARRAIAANPNDAEGYFVMAVAKGRLSLIEKSSRERVKNSEAIKQYSQTAIKFNNKHAGAWHVLGKWNFKIANLSFAEKAAMELIFGGVPKDATNENAINCFLNAIKFSPNYILYHRDLAEAYIAVENFEAARKEITWVLNTREVSPDDPGYQNECKEMLNQLK